MNDTNDEINEIASISREVFEAMRDVRERLRRLEIEQGVVIQELGLKDRSFAIIRDRNSWKEINIPENPLNVCLKTVLKYSGIVITIESG